MGVKNKTSEKTLYQTETNKINLNFIEMQRQIQRLTRTIKQMKTCNILKNHSYNKSRNIEEQNLEKHRFHCNCHLSVSVMYFKGVKTQQTCNLKKLAECLCRKQRCDKIRFKRTFKGHTKYHANTNRIQKTIQKTMKYLQDLFKNINFEKKTFTFYAIKSCNKDLNFCPTK